MKKQNVEKELYPILENESIKMGTFKEVLNVFPLLPKSYLNNI